MPHDQALSRVLNRIQQAADIRVEDHKDHGEWFLLTSDSFVDHQVFSMLKEQWPLIVGPHAHSFALIHCRSGRDSGVWLHHLGTQSLRSEYLCSCHQIAAW